MRFQLFLPHTVWSVITGRSSPDIPESFAVDSNGLSGVVYHDPLWWHHEFKECNNKHSKWCKVRVALDHFPESLEMKVFSYYGYSEFCRSWHFPNITSHLATEVVCLLLHTKFRKSGSLVFRSKLCYKSSSSTILWLDETIQYGTDNFMDLADMRLQLLLPCTNPSGDDWTCSTDDYSLFVRWSQRSHRWELSWCTTTGNHKFWECSNKHSNKDLWVYLLVSPVSPVQRVMI